MFFLIGFSSGDIEIYKLPHVHTLNEDPDDDMISIDEHGLVMPNETICNCIEEFEKANNLKKGGYLMDKINKMAHSLLDYKKVLPFARYKFNCNGDEYFAFFEKKNEFCLVSSGCGFIVEKVKFNSLDGGFAWGFKKYEIGEKKV